VYLLANKEFFFKNKVFKCVECKNKERSKKWLKKEKLKERKKQQKNPNQKQRKEEDKCCLCIQASAKVV